MFFGHEMSSHLESLSSKILYWLKINYYAVNMYDYHGYNCTNIQELLHAST